MKAILTTATFILMSTGIAASADAIAMSPTYTPAPVATQNYDWSGAYVGIFGAGAFGDFEEDVVFGGATQLEVDVSAGGALGGIQVGYDFHSGAWVYGALADIAISGHEASLAFDASPIIPGAAGEVSSQLKYLGTVRGRVGYAGIDRALFYAHGGLAYGETEASVDLGGTNFFKEETSKFGWTIGAGVEYAVTERVSFQTEYSYVDLGEDTIATFDLGGGPINIDENVDFHMIKAGVNFRF